MYTYKRHALYSVLTVRTSAAGENQVQLKYSGVYRMGSEIRYNPYPTTQGT